MAERAPVERMDAPASRGGVVLVAEVWGLDAPLRAWARRLVEGGYDVDRILTTDDLVASDDVFFAATGISDGDFVRGVRYFGDGARTQTIVMRSKTGTIRTIDATHRWTKLKKYSALEY